MFLFIYDYGLIKVVDERVFCSGFGGYINRSFLRRYMYGTGKEGGAGVAGRTKADFVE
jgi:hypothetical protein